MHSRPVVPKCTSECLVCGCLRACVSVWVHRVGLPGVLYSGLSVGGLWRSGCFAHFCWLSSVCQSPYLQGEEVSGWRDPALGVRVSILYLVILPPR